MLKAILNSQFLKKNSRSVFFFFFLQERKKRVSREMLEETIKRLWEMCYPFLLIVVSTSLVYRKILFRENNDNAIHSYKICRHKYAWRHNILLILQVIAWCMNINLEHDTISEHPFIILDVAFNFQNIDIDVKIGIFSSENRNKREEVRGEKIGRKV